MQSKRLLGRNILVTGGSSGIGRAIVEACIDAGASVSVISRRAPDSWDPPWVGAERPNWIRADLADSRLLKSALSAFVNAGEELDVIFHAAVDYGGNLRGSLVKMSEQGMNSAIDTNLRGYLILLQSMLPMLLSMPSALIVCVTSEVVFNGGPFRIPYSATKAAQHVVTNDLAFELAETSIRVVELLPSGMVATPGIARRRTSTSALAAYASPKSFQNVAVLLSETLGEGFHGECLVVEPDGAFGRRGGTVQSQTRRSP